MSFRQFRDPGQFYHEAYASLHFESAKNSLLLGIATRFQFNMQGCQFMGAVGSESPDPSNVYAVVSNHNNEATFVCSPTNDLEQVNELVQGCLADGVLPAFCLAEQGTANLLKIGFEEHGFQLESEMKLRVYRSLKAQKPAGADDVKMIIANKDQQELVQSWVHEFMSESLGLSDMELATRIALSRLEQEQLFLLHDGETMLAMAGFTRALPETISINFVYVPPDSRGRGYGKSMVYWLTRHLMENEGYSETNLNADLANRSALSLYESIGYEEIAVFEKYRIQRG